MVGFFLLTLQQLKKHFIMADAKKTICAKDFYCIKTKTNHKKGEEYKGKRKDLGDALISKTDYDAQEKKKADHNAKIAAADKQRAKEIGQFGIAKQKEEKKKK